MNDIKLTEMAFEARKASYAPYSGYRVGAALLCEDGSVISGCNVENSSYGLCNCAERTAVFCAVSEGKRRFKAIAIAGGTEEGDTVTGYAFPCGACRQVLREFCDPSTFKIIVARSIDDRKEFTLEGLLPSSFGPDNLS
ncbi:MAG: cytidine deaminase [Lachnospiraceae bacterium]|nr:cytidine deaminase [Lachnospiraceae bacterium]